METLPSGRSSASEKTACNGTFEGVTKLYERVQSTMYILHILQFYYISDDEIFRNMIDRTHTDQKKPTIKISEWNNEFGFSWKTSDQIWQWRGVSYDCQNIIIDELWKRLHYCLKRKQVNLRAHVACRLCPATSTSCDLIKHVKINGLVQSSSRETCSDI